MIRIILFLVLIALAAAGAAWVADQPGEVVMSWGSWGARPSLPVFVMLLGIVIVVAILVWTILLDALAHAGTDPARPARAAARPRPACDHARPAGDRARRFQRGPRACRSGAQTRQPRSVGVAAARAIGAARRRPRRRAARLPRHGRTRGYPSARLARPVHRGAARRRSGRRGDDRRGSPETRAVVVLGLACGARLLLRQGRLERRADHSRQQSIVRTDRQGDLPAAARRAADGARAGTAECRS